MVVTGLRASLEASMDIKRDAVGVVDAITAEDMGKFPDTNLAESLQRITGISIDRRNGEGALVSARGFGPEFNLVTLNGRQIPGADGFGNGEITIGGQGSGTRSFNFAQLASEAVTGVEVYKTSRADLRLRRHRRHRQHQDRTAIRQSGNGLERWRQGRLRRVSRHSTARSLPRSRASSA